MSEKTKFWVLLALLGLSVALLLVLGFAPEYLIRVARSGGPRIELTPAAVAPPGGMAAATEPNR